MRALLNNAAMLSLAACFAVGTAATAQNLSFNPQADQGFSLGDAMRAGAASQQPYSPIEHHASTVYGDVGKAVAALMKAYTNGRIDLAKAAVIEEHAELLDMQNSVNRIKAHNEREYTRREHRLAMRQMEREHRAQMEKQMEQRGRELAAVFLPRTLFDPRTGRICWPEVFSRPELAGFRHDMDHLFQGLAAEGPQYDHLYRDPIAQGCQQVLAVLTQNREAMGLDWDCYVECKKMVRGLALRAETWGEADSFTGGSLSGQLASSGF